MDIIVKLVNSGLAPPLPGKNNQCEESDFAFLPISPALPNKILKRGIPPLEYLCLWKHFPLIPIRCQMD